MARGDPREEEEGGEGWPRSVIEHQSSAAPLHPHSSCSCSLPGPAQVSSAFSHPNLSQENFSSKPPCDVGWEEAQVSGLGVMGRNGLVHEDMATRNY